MSQNTEKTNFDSFSEQEFKQIQSNKQKLQELKHYLKTVIELPENLISDTVDTHIILLDKIAKKNKKKDEAARNEEYELAGKYKKRITALENSLLKYDKIIDLL